MSNVQSIISGDELAGLEAFIDGRTVPLGPEDAPRAGRQHEGMKLTDLAQQLAAQTPDVSEHDFDAPFPLSKAPAVRSVTTAQVSGSQVSAYRNLNNGMWSLKTRRAASWPATPITWSSTTRSSPSAKAAGSGSFRPSRRTCMPSCAAGSPTSNRTSRPQVPCQCLTTPSLDFGH